VPVEFIPRVVYSEIEPGHYDIYHTCPAGDELKQLAKWIIGGWMEYVLDSKGWRWIPSTRPKECDRCNEELDWSEMEEEMKSWPR